MIQTNTFDEVATPAMIQRSTLELSKIPTKAMGFVQKGMKLPLDFLHSTSSDASTFGRNSASLDLLAMERPSRPRHVRFSPEIVCHLTLGRKEFSLEEREDSWWQAEEYVQISNRLVKQIHKLARGDALRDKKYCSRGLEQHSRVGTLAKGKIRAASIGAVLEEQDRQTREGIIDEERISSVYNNITSSSQMWASSIGLKDQRAAEMVEDDYDAPVPTDVPATKDDVQPVATGKRVLRLTTNSYTCQDRRIKRSLPDP